MSHNKNMLSHNAILISIGAVAITGVVGVSFSPANAVNILGFCGVISASLFVQLRNQSNTEEVKTTLMETSKDQASHVADVKRTLETTSKATEIKLGDIQQTTKIVHGLVNSALGIQLRLNAELSRWKSDQTGLPADIKTANDAEQMFRDHEISEAKIVAAIAAVPPPELMS